MIALVNPVGNFPLNDDWSYGKVVKDLLQKGELNLTGWISMPLIVQVLWGALFSKLAGFSFTVLRFSTLILSLMGIIATYLIVREINPHRKIAFFSAAILAINPIRFELSNTFMTDIPFESLALLSIFLFIRGLKQNSYPFLISAVAFAIASMLIRQIGLVLTFSFAICNFYKNGINKKRSNSRLYR